MLKPMLPCRKENAFVEIQMSSDVSEQFCAIEMSTEGSDPERRSSPENRCQIFKPVGGENLRDMVYLRTCNTRNV